MQPVNFPQANKVFGPPKDMEESQVASIPAHVGELKRGSCDGSLIVVTAWRSDPVELERIKAG